MTPLDNQNQSSVPAPDVQRLQQEEAASEDFCPKCGVECGYRHKRGCPEIGCFNPLEEKETQPDLHPARPTDGAFAQQPIQLFVCEIPRLILHPNQLYKFGVDETCEKCREYLSEKTQQQNQHTMENSQYEGKAAREWFGLHEVLRHDVARLAQERDNFKDAYENMKAFAESNGLDTTTHG